MAWRPSSTGTAVCPRVSSRTVNMRRFVGLSSTTSTRSGFRVGSRPATPSTDVSPGPVRRTVWIASNKADADTGFVKQPETPMARHRAASSGLFNAVRRITFVCPRPASSSTRRATSKPSISGSLASTRASANGCPASWASRRAASPAAPPSAATALTDHVFSMSTRMLRTVALSSTTSTRSPASVERFAGRRATSCCKASRAVK